MKKLERLTLKSLKGELSEMNAKEQKSNIGGSGVSSFELSCFYNYTSSNGTLNLDADQFSGIADAAAGANYTSSWVNIGGTMYEKRVVSFYNNEEYDYALGTATVYYDSCGNAVGMKDYYNFNAMSAGERTAIAEAATYVGSQIPGASYDIYYGIHD